MRPSGPTLKLGSPLPAPAGESISRAALFSITLVDSTAPVAAVERYLAEYRHVLRESGECQRVLIEILDTFVQAGWPSAQRLAYRIEEIYR